MTASRIWLTAIAATVAVTCSSIAAADRHDRDHGRHWHGDIHHFHDRDYPHWRGGHWYHGYHDGSLGWWWIAADMWYLYPTPIYPYPNPYVPPVVVAPQPPAPVTTVPAPATVWYYCSSSSQYYPYVSTCPEGWQTVPAQPTEAPR